jgi:hypothetical protein
LKLRDAPNLNSKVISVIPFHGKVTYVDEQHHGCDTIGLLSDFPGRVYLKNDSKKVYKNRPIIGSWVHVRYHGKEGYVYSPYLGPDVNQVPKQDFFLISPGENCGDQFYALNQFHTYGVFYNGRKTWIESVDVNYVVQMEGIGFLAPILTTNQNNYLHYVIGSRKQMSTSPKSWSMYRSNPIEYTYKSKARLFDVIVSDSTVTHQNRKEVFKRAFFYERKTGEKQRIDSANYGYDYKIIGEGDLDGDNRTDILLEFQNGEIVTRRLYLSTLAKNGGFYGLAASEDFGYCC